MTDAAKALGGIESSVPNVSALDMGDAEEAGGMVPIDLLHTIRTVNTAMPWLEKSNAPSIVVIASVSGARSFHSSPAYGATKAALIHYPSLAYKLAAR